MNTLMKNRNGNGNMPAATFSGLVDRIFHNNLDRVFSDDFWGFSGIDRGTAVPVNVKDTGTAYELHLVAPGLKKEDFKVELANDMLTISFEQQQQNEDQAEDKGWLRKEYKTRSFSRSFTLDDTLDAGKISARYSDGILQLSIPKKEGAPSLSRTIEIE